MGGKLLDNATIVNFGLNITDSCMNTYNTPTGIGGGGFAFVTADGKGTPPSSAAQQAEFNSFGFYNTCVFYILCVEVRPDWFFCSDNSWYMRPEVIEASSKFVPLLLSCIDHLGHRVRFTRGARPET
jgi:hypothetical protein